jgi:uncharacterized protein with HEPN domain
MNGRIPDKVRLQHILDAITNIENFSAGKTKDHLYSDLMYRSSIERQLEIIGEASNYLSPETKLENAHVPWRKITGFRNFIVHEYFGLDLELVWGILQDNIPQLKMDVLKIVENIDAGK